MKTQDIIFIITFLFILFLKKERWFLYAGLGCFFFAIPLFATWVFFTAERLTWYGSAFILIFLTIEFVVQARRMEGKRSI